MNKLKNKYISYTLLILLFASNNVAYSFSDSLKFEILLSADMLKKLKEYKADVDFIEDFDFTPQNFIQLSTPQQLYILGIGGVVPVSKKYNTHIKSFAYTSNNVLMLIQNKQICVVDSTGNLQKIFSIPSENMGLSKSDYAMYLYDKTESSNGNAVFMILPGGRFAELFKIGTPINAVAENKNLVFFATRNMLFSYDISTKLVQRLAVLPNEKTIVSIAVDSLSNTIFFATPNEIYVLNNEQFVLLTSKVGGKIKSVYDGLYVFNIDKKYLISILGIEGKLKQIKRAILAPIEKKQLTNQFIIDFVKQQKSDSDIISLIKTSPVNFQLGVDDMIYLSENGVSSDVIMEMKNAMKQKLK